MKKVYIGMIALTLVGLLVLSGCVQPTPKPQPTPSPEPEPQEELRAVNGASCSSTSDCDNKYTMVFSNCGCKWSLFETDKLSERVDCQQVCPQPREDKPTLMKCVSNVCNLVWN